MGQNHIVTGLSASDISLYASAATVDSPGEYKLTVSASVTGEDYEVVSISPKTVKVTFVYRNRIAAHLFLIYKVVHKFIYECFQTFIPFPYVSL